MSVPHCPVCGRPADPKRLPFCSIRCADIDLGRWFTGQYRIPVEDEESGEREVDPPERTG